MTSPIKPSAMHSNSETKPETSQEKGNPVGHAETAHVPQEVWDMIVGELPPREQLGVSHLSSRFNDSVTRALTAPVNRRTVNPTADWSFRYRNLPSDIRSAVDDGRVPATSIFDDPASLRSTYNLSGLNPVLGEPQAPYPPIGELHYLASVQRRLPRLQTSSGDSLQEGFAESLQAFAKSYGDQAPSLGEVRAFLTAIQNGRTPDEASWLGRELADFCELNDWPFPK